MRHAFNLREKFKNYATSFRRSGLRENNDDVIDAFAKEGGDEMVVQHKRRWPTKTSLDILQ